MPHCETLPNGVVVRVTKPLTDEERTALSEYLDAARDAVQRRMDDLTDEEREALAERQRAGAARLRKLREEAADR